MSKKCRGSGRVAFGEHEPCSECGKSDLLMKITTAEDGIKEFTVPDHDPKPRKTPKPLAKRSRGRSARPVPKGGGGGGQRTKKRKPTKRSRRNTSR